MPESTTVAAAPVARLIDEFHKLPGIGPKSAQRLAYHVLRAPLDDARALAEAILDVKERITFCTTCQNITDVNPCSRTGAGTLRGPLLGGGGTVWVAHPDPAQWRHHAGSERTTAELVQPPRS